MVAFIIALIVVVGVPVILVNIVVRKIKRNKRNNEIEFLMTKSASHAVAVAIKDALVKEGYRVSEEPGISDDDRPVGSFWISKEGELGSGKIYFSSAPIGVKGQKNYWELCAVSVVTGHLYAAEVASIGLL